MQETFAKAVEEDRRVREQHKMEDAVEAEILEIYAVAKQQMARLRRQKEAEVYSDEFFRNIC